MLDANKPALSVSTVFDARASEVILKAVNVAPEAIQAAVVLRGVQRVGPRAQAVVLASQSLDHENTLTEPKQVYPRKTNESVDSPTFTYGFEPYSLTVLRIPVQ